MGEEGNVHLTSSGTLYVVISRAVNVTLKFSCLSAPDAIFSPSWVNSHLKF